MRIYIIIIIMHKMLKILDFASNFKMSRDEPTRHRVLVCVFQKQPLDGSAFLGVKKTRPANFDVEV